MQWFSARMGYVECVSQPQYFKLRCLSVLLSKTTSHVDEHDLSFAYYPSYIMSWIAPVKAVLCHNQLPCFGDITRGLPHGPVLGSFLFLLFINDII